jgi:hypothetical protein
MTLNADIIKAVKDGSLTIDGKPITEYSERELDSVRRKVANHIRKHPVKAEDLAYIFNALVLACGQYSDDYKNMTLTL